MSCSTARRIALSVMAAPSAAMSDLVMMSAIFCAVRRVLLDVAGGKVAGVGRCPGFPDAEVDRDVDILLREYPVKRSGALADAAAVLEHELFADVYFHFPRVNVCARVARSRSNSPPIGVGAEERALDEIGRGDGA